MKRYPHSDQHAAYRIQVRGSVSYQLAEYLDLNIDSREFEGVTITTITCGVIDQAALLGILNSLYGRGHPIVNVEYLFS